MLVWRMFKLRHENTQDLLEAKHRTVSPAPLYIYCTLHLEMTRLFYTPLCILDTTLIRPQDKTLPNIRFQSLLSGQLRFAYKRRRNRVDK